MHDTAGCPHVQGQPRMDRNSFPAQLDTPVSNNGGGAVPYEKKAGPVFTPRLWGAASRDLS
jgi:hypothetical protein